MENVFKRCGLLRQVVIFDTLKPMMKMLSVSKTVRQTSVDTLASSRHWLLTSASVWEYTERERIRHAMNIQKDDFKQYSGNRHVGEEIEQNCRCSSFFLPLGGGKRLFECLSYVHAGVTSFYCRHLIIWMNKLCNCYEWSIKVRTEWGLTAIESVSILQSSQLLKTGVQDPCSVTGNRHSQRLSVWSYRPRRLLAPVGRA